MKPEWEFLTKTVYDPAVFWVMVTAFATIVTALATMLLVIGTAILALTSYLPLIRARRADLTERFRQELLTPSAQKIFFLASHSFLEFVGDRMPYFSIIQVTPNILQTRLSQIVGQQNIVMTFEIDDQILAPLEEVAYYEEHDEIQFKDVFRIFADHIDVCFSNAEIVKYITWLRANAKPDVYSKLEILHTKIKQFAAEQPRS